MKRVLSLILLAAILISVTACQKPEEDAQTLESTAPGTETVPPEEETGKLPPETDMPAETSEAPGSTDGIDWSGIYTEFISAEFDELQESFLGGIAGVAFIDLDIDDTPEMVMFDLGASASMGVQIFDIIGGAVECISANMSTVGDVFGGDNFSQVYVNCNFFTDFRLMESASGERFFIVESGNGAIDFTYKELITFGLANNGSVTLEQVLYKYSEYDEDGNETAARYEAGRVSCTAEEFTSGYDAFFADNEDLGYEAAGRFFLEDKAYSQDYDGIMAMVEDAISAYVRID